jgi:hypothetical protein
MNHKYDAIVIGAGQAGPSRRTELKYLRICVDIIVRRRAYLRRGFGEVSAFRVDARPNVAAIFTRSARESASIFRITLPRCTFTVISVMKSSLPTCLFTRPRTHQRHDLPLAWAE